MTVHPGWALTGVLGAAALGLLGVWLTNRMNARRFQHEQCQAIIAANQALVTTLQEERSEIKATAIRAEEKATAAAEKAERTAWRQRYWEDYVQLLRAHIAAGNPPPPPEYPPGLLSI